MTTQLTLDGGKYAIKHDHGTNLRAERYGEAWRDLSGDGLVLSMTYRIEELEASLAKATPNGTHKADITLLLEAYDCGQFSNDMLDHPSPDCRAPCTPVREALRRHLTWLQTQPN